MIIRTKLRGQTISHVPTLRPLAAHPLEPREERLVAALTGGGDARITLDPKTGLNTYLSGPYPRDVLAYSSSTVSDISADAFAHLLTLGEAKRDYSEWLGALARRIAAAYDVGDAADMVFAPSGTDLEYVALAAVLGKAPGGIHNVLLGADEIGSGCVHSALGRYFAKETALGHAVTPAGAVAGMGPVSMVDIPVRKMSGFDAGNAQGGSAIMLAMAAEIEAAIALGKHCLVHGVHGSKTGLVLPGLSVIDALQARFGSGVTFVIDACQARITSKAIADYTARGAIVLMTGSKFIGAPPFNGWALVPRDLVAGAAPLPQGFATIFRRAEWPAGWAGRDQLEDSANRSLALRLEAAVFELERFQRLGITHVEAMLAEFEIALSTKLMGPLGVSRVNDGNIDDFLPQLLPIEMRTLATLDVSGLPGLATFEEAQSVHRALALDGFRLGQPVKCVCKDGGWGGTLRVGLAMPQITAWAKLSPGEVRAQIECDMERIAESLQQLLG